MSGRRRGTAPGAEGLVARLWRGEGGQELIELALVLPLLFVVVFGVLELSNVYDREHALAGLSREGANIAARGASLDTVLQVTMANGASMGLDARGGVIASRIQVQGGVPRVVEQRASGGFAGRSALGPVGSDAVGVDPLAVADGRSFYAVELFYDYRSFTPFDGILTGVIPDTMYDRSVF